MPALRTTIASGLAVTGGLFALLMGALQFLFGSGIYVRHVQSGEQGLVMVMGGLVGLTGAVLAWRRPDSQLAAGVLTIAAVFAMEFWMMPPLPALCLAAAAAFAYFEAR